jgi:hypothetical protein
MSRPSADDYARAADGPPAFSVRLRAIDDLSRRHEAELDEAWRALAAQTDADDREFARRWRETASRWDFREVNDLIARHNDYYPIERRLPLDPRTRDFVRVGGRSYRIEPLATDWVLARFPADPAAARAAGKQEEDAP